MAARRPVRMLRHNSGTAAFLGDRELGDTVFGTFAGRGSVNDPMTGINTTDKIDPFFFAASVPEPSAAVLLALGGLAMALLRRRRSISQ